MLHIYNIPILNRINLPTIQFRASESAIHDYQPLSDSYVSNPLDTAFVDKNELAKIAKSSPEIMSILEKYKLKLNVNIRELEKLQNGHLRETRVMAAKIYSSLPPELKSQVNLVDLQQAAMLHDYGKVLIPDNILNKNGVLQDKEKEIMQLHSELGYELLKKQGINQNVLNLVKYHHQNPQKNGYPEITNDFTPDLASQILTVADKYSALREKRSYKEAMGREDALKIIKNDVDIGLISSEVFNSLAKVT